MKKIMNVLQSSLAILAIGVCVFVIWDAESAGEIINPHWQCYSKLADAVERYPGQFGHLRDDILNEDLTLWQCMKNKYLYSKRHWKDLRASWDRQFEETNQKRMASVKNRLLDIQRDPDLVRRRWSEDFRE